MACEICGRNSCTRSFHSIKEQERFDDRQKMSNNVDDLRVEIQYLQDELKNKEEYISSLENRELN